MNNSMLKPAAVGLVAFAIDSYYLKESNFMRSVYFGGAVAVGNYSAEYLYPLVKHIPIPTISKDLYEGKTLVDRILEVGSSTALTYVINKYIILNDNYRNELLLRMGVIAASDVIGTYAVEYMTGQKLEFLTHE